MWCRKAFKARCNNRRKVSREELSREELFALLKQSGSPDKGACLWEFDEFVSFRYGDSLADEHRLCCVQKHRKKQVNKEIACLCEMFSLHCSEMVSSLRNFTWGHLRLHMAHRIPCIGFCTATRCIIDGFCIHPCVICLPQGAVFVCKSTLSAIARVAMY